MRRVLSIILKYILWETTNKIVRQFQCKITENCLPTPQSMHGYAEPLFLGHCWSCPAKYIISCCMYIGDLHLLMYFHFEWIKIVFIVFLYPQVLLWTTCDFLWPNIPCFTITFHHITTFVADVDHYIIVLGILVAVCIRQVFILSFCHIF